MPSAAGPPDLPPIPSGDQLRVVTDPVGELRRRGFDVHEVPGGLVAADRLPDEGRPASDHVIGPGGASATLSGLTPRRGVDRALDLGCGCGIQAVGLAGHAAQVIATDVNPRAVALTRLSAGLSGPPAADRIEARAGSWFAPVAGERFDLIVANPPFVIGDPDVAVYRSAGLTGDEATWRAASGAAAHLAPGGTAVLLGSWLIGEGADWRERPVQQLAATGCDLRVIQRQVLAVADYVDLWLSDGARLGDPERDRLAERWAAALGALGAVAVGSGWILLRQVDRGPVAELIHDPAAVAMPFGAEVDGWFQRSDWLARTDDADLLAATLVRSPDVVVAGGRVARPGRLLDAPVDEVGAAVLAAADGTRSAGELLAAAASACRLPEAALRAAGPGALRGLVAAGALLPPALP